jgi:hypothetical protein
MAVSFEHDRLQVPDTVVMRVVDDSAVLLDTVSGRYFALDEVGRRAWVVLTQAASLQQAHDTLMAEYDVTPQRLRQDLEALVERLVSLGLVEVRRVEPGAQG